MPSSDEHRSKRPKTTLACDVCRHRKSRCDGARPKCSYCLNAGLDCIYRGPPTLDPTLGEFDAVTIMTRLARVEAIAIKAASERRSQGAFTPDEHHNNTGPCGSYHTLPDLHTGANHKVLQYWSRLRVRLNPCGVAVLRFLREAEQSIPSPLHHELPVSSVNDAQEALQWLSKHRHRLPLSLSILLLSTDIFDIDSVAIRIADLQEPHYWQRLELRDLLVCSLAFSTLTPSDGNGWDGPAAASSMQAASAHLSLAMQGLSTLFVEDEDVSVALLLGLAGILLHCFGRPYLSLSLLQAAEPALRRLLDSVVDKPFDDATVSTYERLFYLLQGDVLSEVDGRPSRLSPSPPRPLRGHIDPSAPVSTTPPEWPGNDRRKDVSEPDSNIPIRSATKHPDFATYLPTNLWLRSCTNHILNQLYIPSQAYCRPAETVDLISQISSDLQAWYHTLPVGIRFSRDLRTLRASRSAMPLRQRELAIRYHNCIFLLNRPILYYVLYQDFEQSRPPSPVGESADGGHDMWALESCHTCIDAATMIICILNHCFNHEAGPAAIPPTWAEVQMLLGAYAILLSVQATPSRCQALRDTAELAQLLDLAESVMSNLFNRSEVFKDILKIMLNMRQGFQSESPSTGMIGWLGIGAGVG